MTPEGKVKKQVKEYLTSIGAWFFMPVSNGFGVMGIPDFIGCHKGRFFAVETKSGKATPTLRQTFVIEAIRRAGGLVLIINETNLHEIQETLL